MRKQLFSTTTALALLCGMGVAHADMEAARAFLDAEIGDM